MATERTRHDAAAGVAAAAARLSDADAETYREFKHVVNMSAASLARWLGTEESQAVGYKPGGKADGKADGHESVGHHSGRRIVELLHTKKADLTPDDCAHMRKVIGYVKRHLAQRPDGDVRYTRWRWSLMNWGHDPLKK